jgi:dTDP-L-rhamnose 4-epimerase
VIFEDGMQLRDFVSVRDVVRANLLAMEKSGADGRAVNIGSGNPVTIARVAEELQQALNTRVSVEMTGKYRAGDVRHCFADVSAARKFLGYRPSCSMADGVRELAGWLESQQANDFVDEAMNRLTIHGLVA